MKILIVIILLKRLQSLKDLEERKSREKSEAIGTTITDEEIDDEDYEELETDENLFGKIIIRVRTFLFNQLRRVKIQNTVK